MAQGTPLMVRQAHHDGAFACLPQAGRTHATFDLKLFIKIPVEYRSALLGG
jgi:hypothetical protein